MKGENDLKPFTYSDYQYYQSLFQEKKVSLYHKLSDVSEDYQYEQKISHPHDKIFKEILEDKKEVVKFLNEVLQLENSKHLLKPSDIEKYNREFITENFSRVESDVIYKKINQNIFFLIEQQSTIDYAMPYRILKYNIAIMESAIDLNKLKQKNYKLPTIFSFVIYTGNKPWNATNYLREKQEKLFGCQINSFANFQVIDVNRYTKEELLQKESLLAKIMLLEKAQNYEELEKYLQEIINLKLEDNQKLFLRRIIQFTLKNKLSKNNFEELIEKLQIKQEKGGDSMYIEILNRTVGEVFGMEERLKAKLEAQIAEAKKKVEREDKKLEKLEQKEKRLERKEEKMQQKEEKMQQKEEKMQQKEEEMQQKEEEMQQKEEKIKQKEKNIYSRENEMVLKMIKQQIDEKDILKIMDIDKNRLEKIKEEKSLSAI